MTAHPLIYKAPNQTDKGRKDNDDLLQDEFTVIHSDAALVLLSLSAKDLFSVVFSLKMWIFFPPSAAE